jgi:polar amino acid transport system substrate-binding protein
MAIRLVIILSLLLSFSASSRSYDDVTESGRITIAVYNDFPPYSYLDNDTPAGFDIELGKLIAKGLGVEIEWLWLNADENLEDDLRNAIWKGHIVTRKKADLMLRVPYDRRFAYAIDGYGQAKNELVTMFGPYQTESWAILRDLEKTGDVRTLALFQYEKIAVEIDSLPSFFLGSTIGGRLRDKLVHVPSIFEGVEQLKAGKLAAVAGMKGQLQWSMGPLSSQYDITQDGLSAMSVKTWDIGMAVKQDYRQLAYAIEDIITPYIKDGTLQRLSEQYNMDYTVPSLYAQ